MNREENWYVVTNAVTISGRLYFADDTAHLILCDGATLAVTNANGYAIDAYDLTIYGQTNGTGTVTATGTNGGGIYAGYVTINGGTVTANGSEYGDGICAPAPQGSIILGWTKPTDSITASSYHAGKKVSVKEGQWLTDGSTIYQSDSFSLFDLAGKTLRPYIETPSFNDPEGVKINDPDVISWLSANNFKQSDINALGSDSDATDKLYECYILNCSITAANPGGALSITGIAVSNGIVSVTVQLVRQSPQGYISGVLNLYGASDLAAIDETRLDFGNDDTTFDTKADGLITQTVTATFDSSFITANFFKAKIEFPIPEEPWEPEPDPEPDPEEPEPDPEVLEE